MDFIVGLPRTSRGYNSIWVIIDCLTKLAHFIPLSTIYRVRQYAELYMSHIVRYHGISKTIISDRASIFVARFWEQLHECLGTHLIWSSAYHPQAHGQTERVNQIIEDMLRACVLTDGRKWDNHFPLAEFSKTIATKRASRCHLSKNSMDDHAAHHWADPSLAKGLSLVQTLW
jgi:hypothetical protein